MGAHRYCEDCGSGQETISVEDIVRSGSFPVSCVDCGAPRPDDTAEERTVILASIILELRELVQSLVSAPKESTADETPNPGPR